MRKIFVMLLVVIVKTCLAQVPTITSFSPASGSIGTLIYIKGNNLKNPTTLTIVGVNGIVVSSNDTTIVAMLMPTTSFSGNIYVANANGGFATTKSFTVTPTLQPENQQNVRLKTDYITSPYGQGVSNAISADGNTAVVGTPYQFGGYITVYTRKKNNWSIEASYLHSNNGLGAITYQGISLAISADGNTILAGDYRDSNRVGAAYVYTRTGNVWSEQAKLSGTGAVGKALMGFKVALSADGNTAVLGGANDNGGIGATWVFTRTNGVWTQLGNKLVGGNYVGQSKQGGAVAISANGRYIVVGGYGDNNYAGKLWIYIKSGNAYVQQYYIYSNTANAYYGYSVSINADGTTLAAGQPGNGDGKINIFTRSGSVWTYSTDLVASDATSGAELGFATTISADGNTIFASADYQDYRGAFYIYKKVSGTWTQYGNARYSDDLTDSSFAYSVCISADGNTGIVSSPNATNYEGSSYVYVSSLPRISSFSPQAAQSNQSVTIKGIGFTGTNKVTFGGKAAYSFYVLSDSVIEATNNDGNSGYIAITNNYGVDSIPGFTYCSQYYYTYNNSNYLFINSDTIIHEGAQILFRTQTSISSFPPDSLCTFHWYKNNIAVGLNKSYYLDSTLVTGDSVYCFIEFNTSCIDKPNFRFNAFRFTVLPNTSFRINTIAGSIRNNQFPSSFYGDGGQSTNAALALPCGLALDKKRNVLYVADYWNYRVRKIDLKTGLISTYAGGGSAGLGDNGPAVWASLGTVSDVCLDSIDNLYIAENQRNRIRKVDTSGIITTVAGDGTSGYAGDGTSAVAAKLNDPRNIAMDNYGNLYISDKYNHVIRKVDKNTGIITTIAGKGVSGFSGDGGQAIYAKLSYPEGIRFDKQNNLYIADYYNGLVRKVNATNNFISTFIGGGNPVDGLGDGLPATWATLKRPQNIAFDTSGNCYVTDEFDNRIRKITANTSIISTVCGQGSWNYWYNNNDSVFNGDGGFATAASISYPSGIIADGEGNVYFSDASNGRVRKIYFAETDTVFAISGKIINPKKNSINNVSLLIKQQSTNTNKLVSANYLISTNSSQITTVKPTKNNDIAKANGVTSVDVLLTQRHILNTAKLNSAYKIIAADVDGNKAVNSVDVLRMKRLILGTDTTFISSIKGNRLWEFVDSAYQFPDTTNPFPFKDSISFTNLTSNKTNQTFIGVKLGDVNYDWNPAVARGVAASSLQLVASGKETTTSNLPLTITSTNFNNIAALQTTLHFDNTKYEFVSIENGKLQLDYNASKANSTGNIALLWTDKNAEAKTFDKEEVLFIIVLKPKNKLPLTTSYSPLTINNDIAETEAWDDNSNKRSIVLSSREINYLPLVTNHLLIYPNPANGIVNIDCNNAKQIKITDALGRIVKQINSVTLHQTINTKQFVKGIYLVQIVMNDGTVKNERLVVE